MNKIVGLRLLVVIFCIYISSSVFAFSPDISNAIYNGDKVTSDTQFPFVVVIVSQISQDKGEMCTGSIVGKNWVLTAGHCVRMPFDPTSTSRALLSPDALFVGVGLDVKKPSQTAHFVHPKKIFPFSDKSDSGHDIALLQLADATDIQPVALPAYDDFPNLRTSQLPATAVGYGWIDDKPVPNDLVPTTEESGDIHAPTKEGTIGHIDGYLHYGDEIIQDDQTVEKFAGIIDDNERKAAEDDMAGMLGVLSPDGKRMTDGDSGGPLLLAVTQKDNSKQYVQIGVASWMLPKNLTSKEEYFSMYANLTNRDMLDFINNTMKNNP